MRICEAIEEIFVDCNEDFGSFCCCCCCAEWVCGGGGRGVGRRRRRRENRVIIAAGEEEQEDLGIGDSSWDDVTDGSKTSDESEKETIRFGSDAYYRTTCESEWKSCAETTSAEGEAAAAAEEEEDVHVVCNRNISSLQKLLTPFVVPAAAYSLAASPNCWQQAASIFCSVMFPNLRSFKGTNATLEPITSPWFFLSFFFPPLSLCFSLFFFGCFFLHVAVRSLHIASPHGRSRSWKKETSSFWSRWRDASFWKQMKKRSEKAKKNFVVVGLQIGSSVMEEIGRDLFLFLCC